MIFQKVDVTRTVNAKYKSGDILLKNVMLLKQVSRKRTSTFTVNIAHLYVLRH